MHEDVGVRFRGRHYSNGGPYAKRPLCFVQVFFERRLFFTMDGCMALALSAVGQSTPSDLSERSSSPDQRSPSCQLKTQ